MHLRGQAEARCRARGQLGDWGRRFENAGGRAVGGYVVGLAVHPLNGPGIRTDSNRARLTVADVAVLAAVAVEPGVKLGVGNHLGELMTGYLSPSLFLGFAQLQRTAGAAA